MSTLGVNANVQRVRVRPAADNYDGAGQMSDIFDQTSTTLAAFEFPAGFEGAVITFFGSGSCLSPGSSNLTVNSPNQIARSSRYIEDPKMPFVAIRDEADAAVTITVPASLPAAVPIDSILPDLAPWKFLRFESDTPVVAERVCKVHTKEP